MKKFILITILLTALIVSSCIFDNNNGNDGNIIGDTSNYNKDYIFHSGYLEDIEPNGWKLSFTTTYDSISVLLNKRQIDGWIHENNKVWITVGDAGDPYLVIEFVEKDSI